MTKKLKEYSLTVYVKAKDEEEALDFIGELEQEYAELVGHSPDSIEESGIVEE